MNKEKTMKEDNLKVCYDLYNKYKWLIDGYVINFYTQNNWDKLPSSWRRDLENITCKSFAQILDYKNTLNIIEALPLSLLALRKLVCLLDVPRDEVVLTKEEEKLTLPEQKTTQKAKTTLGRRVFNEKVEKLMWKHIKRKKQHEISRMAEITHQTAKESNCPNIVDVGSGVGHLSRLLSYGYGLKMCAVEAQLAFSHKAKELDKNFQSFVDKHLPDLQFTNDSCPVHVNTKIDFNISSRDFLQIVKEALVQNVVNQNLDVNKNSNSLYENNSDVNFGVIALHACGDLSATLLRLYNTCDNIKFLNIVGCCYMKLTVGYPLSQFSISHCHTLTYNSKEVACHAIDNYVERLNNGRYSELKIHAYRAVLEKILKENWPEHCQSPLANVKYTQDLTFYDYCQKAVRKLDLVIDKNVIDEGVIKDLEQWNRVVIFYSLRLLLAPVVETIILLDRFLYVLENGGPCELIPAFDPKLSPRNHILSCKKKLNVKISNVKI